MKWWRERRFRALRDIHPDNGDPKIPCVLRDVDTATADAMSLGENFGREAMHPLDEAEAFAKLANSDGKDAQAIASRREITTFTALNVRSVIARNPMCEKK